MGAPALDALGRSVRHLNRWRQVALILAKHGLGDLLHTLRLDQRLAPALAGIRHPALLDEAGRPERLRRALEELGPTFIKAGQYLSTRSDLLAPEYLAQLARLQDSVPPFSGDEAARVVEEELGAPVDALFARFERTPMAAASLAQAHAAELPGGGRVVVKVQRPGVRETVAVDLEIMAQLAALAERRLEDWRWRRPARIAAELARTLDRELDLGIEASHAERFAREFRGDPSVRAPRVYRALSGPRVLTLERLDGVKADDLAGLEAAGLDSRVVAERLAAHYLVMIFEHGFFHADPHPGNLLVLPGHAIGYLDFGMAGRLERSLRDGLADAVLAVVERDERALGRALLSLASYDEPPDPREFEADVAALMDQYAYRPLAEWRLGRMLEQLFHTTATHRVRVPAELFLTVKAVSELESLARLLDPRFDAVGAAAPYIRRALSERRSPARLAREAREAGADAARLLASAPRELMELLRQARRGRLLLEFEHKGLEPALSTLDRVSNRVSFALLLAALLIGSALLAQARLPPLWNGSSLPGLGGFGLAALMAAWLLAAILRHGRL